MALFLIASSKMMKHQRISSLGMLSFSFRLDGQFFLVMQWLQFFCTPISFHIMVVHLKPIFSCLQVERLRNFNYMSMFQSKSIHHYLALDMYSSQSSLCLLDSRQRIMCSYFLGICFSTSIFSRRNKNGRNTLKEIQQIQHSVMKNEQYNT